jgi:hypothetical protein
MLTRLDRATITGKGTRLLLSPQFADCVAGYGAEIAPLRNIFYN